MTVEQLHAEFGGYLLARLRYYGTPAEDCEDVRQDIYLTLLRRYDRGDFAANRGFCSVIARNASVSYRRRTQTDILTAPLDSPAIAAELSSTALNDWYRINHDNCLDDTLRILQKAATFMFRPNLSAYDLIQDCFDGLTARQIAQKYAVSKMTVSRWLNAWWAYASTK